MITRRIPILLAVLCACAARGDEHGGVTVRDSLGITIVESQLARWPPDSGWRLAGAPTLTIGVAAGPEEYQLFRVTAARRLSDGRIVVGNAGSHQIRLFDPAGKFLVSAGRRGGGPGEFEGLGNIDRFQSDSLLVYDYRLARFSVFSTDLGFGRTFQPERLHGGTPRPNGVVVDSLVLTAAIVTEGDARRVPGNKRRTMLHAAYRPDGTILDTLGRFPGAESYSASAGPDMTVLAPSPFGRNAEIAVARDRWFIGLGDAYEIEERSPEGALRRLIRRPIANRPVPASLAAERREWMEDMIRGMGGRIEADVQIPATMPAYGSFLVDADGYLWVQEYRVSGEQPAWAVFSPDGRFLGLVDVPAGGTLFEIGSDYVLGVWRDEAEVEQVRVYGLQKSEP